MTAVMSGACGSFSRAVAASFSRASESYIGAARLQQQVALDALALLPQEARGSLLDLGCGPGWLHPRLTRYCERFTAVDLSLGMLEKAAQQQLASDYIQADAQALPLAAASFDKVFSSLMLQWCVKPALVFGEIARVLQPGGRAVVTTLVEGTLSEFQQAFRQLDDAEHIHRFLTADQIVAAAGTATTMRWQAESRSYPLYYPDVLALARELKALGAHQVAGRCNAAEQGLTGKGYWQSLEQAYQPFRTMLGLPATYQVLTLSGYKAN